jgi:hypothetical protein
LILLSSLSFPSLSGQSDSKIIDKTETVAPSKTTTPTPAKPVETPKK